MVDNCLELKRYSSCFCVMRNELYAWCVASFAVGRVTDTHRAPSKSHGAADKTMKSNARNVACRSHGS